MANQNAAANLTDDARSKGGKMAHENGAHEFSHSEAVAAGHKSSGNQGNTEQHKEAGSHSHDNM